MAHKRVCDYVDNEADLHCDNVAFVQIAIEYRQKEVMKPFFSCIRPSPR